MVRTTRGYSSVHLPLASCSSHPCGHSGPRVCPPGPPGLHVHLPSPALTLRGEAAIGFLGLPTPMPSVTPSLIGKPKGLVHGCTAEQGSGGRVKTLKGDKREWKSAGPDTCPPPPRPSPTMARWTDFPCPAIPRCWLHQGSPHLSPWRWATPTSAPCGEEPLGPMGSALAWDTYLCSPSLPPLVFSLPLLSRGKK